MVRALCPRCGRGPYTAARAPSLSAFVRAVVQRSCNAFWWSAFWRRRSSFCCSARPSRSGTSAAECSARVRAVPAGALLINFVKRVGRTGFEMAFERNTWSPATRWKSRGDFPQLANALERQVDAMVFGDLFPHRFHLRRGSRSSPHRRRSRNTPPLSRRPNPIRFPRSSGRQRRKAETRPRCYWPVAAPQRRCSP